MSYIGKSPVPVIIGGTGDTTLTAHGVLLGEGTSAVSATAAGTAGQVLLSGGSSADPGYVTPTAGSGLSVTTNATTLSYAVTAFPLPVSSGGTGATTFTTGYLLQGNGTSAITAVGSATNGQIPIGSTGSSPVFATITAGSGATVTNASNSITIAATGAGSATINGNSGSATGNPITITTGSSNANGTSKFTGSGATMTLSFSGASGNLGIGTNSLAGSLLTGSNNVCYGSLTGSNISSGSSNTLMGYGAGGAITSGSNNTAIGYIAGAGLVSTSGNCLFGGFAAANATGSNNTCIGYGAGLNFTSGSYNTLVGYNAGSNYTGSESSNVCFNSGGTAGESNTLRIGAGTGTGTQQLNSTFIFGISGVTVTGTAVLVSTGNQLGVLSSSERFKNDIRDMEDESECIYALRPVTFNWNRDSSPGLSDASEKRQYGLVAEEVVEVMPSLVTYGEDKQPLNVDYTGLSSLVLNEVQKLSKRVSALRLRSERCHI